MAAEVIIGNNDYGKYLPRKHHEEDAWVFQEAFADAFAYPHVLPSHLWKKLSGYYKIVPSELHKFYHSRSDALRSLERAIAQINRKSDIIKYIEKYL